MRIGIDISQIVYGTGVSVYTDNLVKSLLTLDKQNEYVLFGGTLRKYGFLKSRIDDFRNINSKVQGRIFPLSPVFANLIWNKLHILPIEKLIGDINVFHSSDWAQPPSSAFKITTIHDLSPIIMPKISKKNLIRDIVKTQIARLARVREEADLLIAVSTSTKNDIINYLGIPEEKIRVIYEAANPVFSARGAKEIETVKKKFKIRGDYILSVGNSPRKNIDRSIKAYESIKGKLNVKFVIVGNDNFNFVRGVINLRNISAYDLSCFYSGALAFVYPSLYEGFGVPILEAYACHCPVITSNLSSMPEIAGDAAVLVDPYQVDSIAEGIFKAIRGKKGLIEKGERQIENFSWEKTAEETLKVYLDINKSNL